MPFLTLNLASTLLLLFPTARTGDSLRKKNERNMEVAFEVKKRQAKFDVKGGKKIIHTLEIGVPYRSPPL